MLRNLLRSYADLSHSKLILNLSKNLKSKPTDYSKIVFGSVFTDHMLEVDWTESAGWAPPEIKPYQPLKLDPSSSVFHYCTECHEVFKIYSNLPHVLSFRPQDNLIRFNACAEATGLSACDPNELLKCIDIGKEWAPQCSWASLYARPNMIGTHAQLGVVKPKSAKIVVILLPVGPYFVGGFQPLSLYCDESFIRAWPGGHGNKKLGGNYSTGLVHVENIRKKGYREILWLSEEKVTESGIMNFFVLWNNGKELELITSPINSTVLPGITRDSILQLAREWGEFKVSERDYTIHELVSALKQNRVIEAFGAGTAAVICPVNLISYKGDDYQVPIKLGKCGELTQRIYDELLNIQYGKIKHRWNHYIH